jgi:hypothetical protein
MHKLLIVAVSAAALAGCTAREQQVLTAGAVGAVAGAVIVNEMNQPRPVYVEERYEQRYVPVPPRRPRCFTTWENTHRGMIERRVCDRY